MHRCFSGPGAPTTQPNVLAVVRHVLDVLFYGPPFTYLINQSQQACMLGLATVQHREIHGPSRCCVPFPRGETIIPT